MSPVVSGRLLRLVAHGGGDVRGRLVQRDLGAGSDLWAVGSGGAIYHSTTQGSWKKVDSGTTKDLRAIHGTSASNVYVVGDDVILHKKQ